MTLTHFYSVNNWSDYGGMDVYVSQLNNGGTHDSFYTNAKITAAFQNYIKGFVGRYANEPVMHFARPLELASYLPWNEDDLCLGVGERASLRR